MNVKEFIKMSERWNFCPYLNDDVNVFLDDDRTEVFNNLVNKWTDEGETKFYVVEVKTASEYYVVNKYGFYIKIFKADQFIVIKSFYITKMQVILAILLFRNIDRNIV